MKIHPDQFKSCRDHRGMSLIQGIFTRPPWLWGCGCPGDLGVIHLPGRQWPQEGCPHLLCSRLTHRRCLAALRGVWGQWSRFFRNRQSTGRSWWINILGTTWESWGHTWDSAESMRAQRHFLVYAQPRARRCTCCISVSLVQAWWAVSFCLLFGKLKKCPIGIFQKAFPLTSLLHVRPSNKYLPPSASASQEFFA